MLSANNLNFRYLWSHAWHVLLSDCEVIDEQLKLVFEVDETHE